MSYNLKSIMDPETPALFHDRYARKEWFHLSSTDNRRFERLLSWETINYLIESDVFRRESARILRNGHIIDRTLYCVGKENDRPRTGALQALLRQGATLLLAQVHRHVPDIGRLAASLARESSCRVHCNGYVAIGSGSALPRHADLHDVLVLQVHGRKRWQGFGTYMPHPVGRAPQNIIEQMEQVWEARLEAGDVLYLPRGHVHKAMLDGSDSVHLTIGFEALKGNAVIEHLAKAANDEVIFRQDLPAAYDRDAIAQREAALKSALHALVNGVDLAALLDEASRNRALLPLANLGFLGFPSPNAVIVPALRSRLPMALDVAGEVEILAGKDVFRLSAPARWILDYLLRHDEAPFSTLISVSAGKMDQDEVQAAVTELATQGLVGIRQ